jgi:pimeloyl-ACP methyl ester carboxylesterase
MNEKLQVTTGFLDVPGGQLYYEVAGTGHPLVFIHAGVADNRMWDEQFVPFAERYRVIRYDTRGFGKTRTEEVEFSNRQDLYDLLTHLGVEKAYVIGLSRGGQIAVDFTVEHPEMVAALIPAAAGLSGYDQPLGDSDAVQQEAALFTRMEELWEKGAHDELQELEVHAWVDGPRQPVGRAASDVRERVREMNAGAYNRGEPEPKPQPLDPPAAGRLHEIAVPTLVLIGDLDELATQAMAEYMAQHIPGARKVVFPGAAHMVNMEQPERFNEVVLEFLDRVEK